MTTRDEQRGRLVDQLGDLHRKARGRAKAEKLRAMRRAATELAELCIAEAERLEGATRE